MTLRLVAAVRRHEQPGQPHRGRAALGGHPRRALPGDRARRARRSSAPSSCSASSSANTRGGALAPDVELLAAQRRRRASMRTAPAPPASSRTAASRATRTRSTSSWRPSSRPATGTSSAASRRRTTRRRCGDGDRGPASPGGPRRELSLGLAWTPGHRPGRPVPCSVGEPPAGCQRRTQRRSNVDRERRVSVSR